MTGVGNLGTAIRATIVFAFVGPASPVFADGGLLEFGAPTLIAAEGTVQQRSEPAPAQIAPPEAQHWAIGIGGLFTHRKDETAAWAPSIEVNYSPSDRLQFHALVPIVYDKLRGGAAHFGVGDIEVGLRYRFVDDDPQGWRPAVAVYPLVDFPTGRLSENLGTGRIHAFLPLWFSKTIGAWIPFGGGGYWINPGPANKNWTFAAVGVIRVLSPQWVVSAELFHATSTKTGTKEQTGFSIGAQHNFTENHHLLVTIGRGLQNAQDTNEITSYVQYMLTF